MVDWWLICSKQVSKWSRKTTLQKLDPGIKITDRRPLTYKCRRLWGRLEAKQRMTCNGGDRPIGTRQQCEVAAPLHPRQNRARCRWDCCIREQLGHSTPSQPPPGSDHLRILWNLVYCLIHMRKEKIQNFTSLWPPVTELWGHEIWQPRGWNKN
jgi:hypothetical protein